MAGITFQQAIFEGIIISPEKCICRNCSNCQMKYDKIGNLPKNGEDDKRISFCEVCAYATDSESSCVDCRE